MTSPLVKSNRLAIGFFAAIATTSLSLGGLKVSAQATAPGSNTTPSSAPDTNSTPSPAPDTNSTPSPAPDTNSTPSPAPDTSSTSTPVLKIGSRGKLLQQLLLE